MGRKIMPKNIVETSKQHISRLEENYIIDNTGKIGVNPYGPIYWFGNKYENRNKNKQSLSFPYKKLHRGFVFDILNKYSNTYGSGFASYLSIKGHAVSSKKYYKGNKSPIPAWSSGSKGFFEKITGDRYFFGKNIKLRDISEKSPDLIDCGYLSACSNADMVGDLSVYNGLGRISFTFPQNGTKDVSGRKIKADFAAINSHSGYVFSKFNDVRNFLRPSRAASECDAIADLWMNTVYNDESIPVSMGAPIVIFSKEDTNSIKEKYDILGNLIRNSVNHRDNEFGDGKTDICTATMRQLSKRWNMSLGKVHSLLERFKKDGFIDYISVPNRGITVVMKCFSRYMWGEEYVPVNVSEIYREYFPEKYSVIYKNYIFKKVISFINNMKLNKTAKQKFYIALLNSKIPAGCHFSDSNLRSFLKRIFLEKRKRESSIYRCFRVSQPIPDF